MGVTEGLAANIWVLLKGWQLTTRIHCKETICLKQMSYCSIYLKSVQKLNVMQNKMKILGFF